MTILQKSVTITRWSVQRVFPAIQQMEDSQWRSGAPSLFLANPDSSLMLFLKVAYSDVP